MILLEHKKTFLSKYYLIRFFIILNGFVFFSQK